MMKNKVRFLRSQALTILLAATVATVLCLTFSACGESGLGEENGAPLAMSDASRLPAAAPAADVDAAAGSIRDFGVDLYALLAAQANDGNLVFSPASIVTALTMTYAGAAGSTAEEMAAALHLTLEDDALHQAFNTLDTALESRSWEGKDSEGKDVGVLVKTANSLWAQRDLTFEEDFLDTLAADYGAGVRLVDYVNAAEEARKAINSWVADETNDKIPELIAQGILNALTRLVLVNAVYLDATWTHQFDPDLTRDADFTTLTGDTVTASMMNETESLPYAAADGWQAVELSYLHGDLAMLLIVPDQGLFPTVEGQLGTGLLQEAVKGLESGYTVNLGLPKFEFRTQAGLNRALANLGMVAAFDPGSADFSAMTKQEKLFISDVIHEAYIDVDEEGTEAAAATAVVMELTSAMPGEFVQLIIDRPFIFAIRDRETGTVLFLGRVTDPTV